MAMRRFQMVYGQCYVIHTHPTEEPDIFNEVNRKVGRVLMCEMKKKMKVKQQKLNSQTATTCVLMPNGIRHFS